MSSELRVLIIGCGNIAGGFDAARPAGAAPLTHAGAFLQHGAFALAACIDPDDERRAGFMARWSIPQGFPALDRLPAAVGSFDVISICSPTPLHSEHLAGVQNLKPRLIFCEKPLTLCARDSQHWVQQCEQAGVLLAVNHLRRWAPDVRRLRQEIHAGVWGELRSVVAHYNKGILNNGSHMIDLLNYLIGPLDLLYIGPAARDFWDDDPTVTAVLSTEKGIPVYLNAADARDYSFFELELITSTAVLVMEEGGARWRIRKIGDSSHFKGYRAAGVGEYRDGEIAHAMTHAVANIHEAIRSNAPLASTGRDALVAQLLCERIRAEGLAGLGTEPKQLDSRPK
jgi:predicted dehydrogenase